MDELMKMLDGLFEHIAGKIRQAGQEWENQEDDGEDTEKHPRMKKACATVLTDMRREIHSLERALAALNAKREILIEEHNALVDEVKAMEKEEEPKSANAGEASPSSEPSPEQQDATRQPEPPPEEGGHEEEHQGADEQLASELKLDGLSRLERLTCGLDHAIKVLDGSKMAFHFKAIKQLRLNLTELANIEDRPEEERIAELENGLKHAVEVLSTSPNAANSKTMRQLWGDLIVVLKQ